MKKKKVPEEKPNRVKVEFTRAKPGEVEVKEQPEEPFQLLVRTPKNWMEKILALK